MREKQTEFARGYQTAMSDLLTEFDTGGIEALAYWIKANCAPDELSRANRLVAKIKSNAERVD